MVVMKKTSLLIWSLAMAKTPHAWLRGILFLLFVTAALLIGGEPFSEKSVAFAQSSKSQILKQRCAQLVKLKRRLPIRCRRLLAKPKRAPSRKVQKAPAPKLAVPGKVIKKATRPKTATRKSTTTKTRAPARKSFQSGKTPRRYYKKRTTGRRTTSGRPVSKPKAGRKVAPVAAVPASPPSQPTVPRAVKPATGATPTPATPPTVGLDTGVAVPVYRPDTPDAIVASRLFARKGEAPASNFKAYGILAFRTLANDDAKRERYELICNAFRAVLPSSDEVGAPNEDQMVTVWPLQAVDDPIFRAINFDLPGEKTGCQLAVENYSLVISKAAVRHARAAGATVKGRGPYLFAWAPPEQKGDKGAVVLQLDMSDVTTAERAEELLLLWAERIEGDPGLWKDGWDVESVRLAIRLFVDKFGDKIVSLVKK